MIHDEPHNPLLPLNDGSKVCQLANVLDHEIQRVRNTLYHCDMWVPAMIDAGVSHSKHSGAGSDA
jgi:hypothetical protein